MFKLSNKKMVNNRCLAIPMAALALAGVLFWTGGCRGTTEVRPGEEPPDETPVPALLSPEEYPDLYDLPDNAYADLYLIHPHDLLDISVLGESDLSLSVRVSDRGTISYPLLGEVRAAGHTPSALERNLEELLGKDYLVSPSVNVGIKEHGSISVLGQVNKPGSFEIKGRLTVTQAIAQAGGLTKTASPNRTRIIRRFNSREEIIPVRLNDIFRSGDLSQDVRLQPGDLVVVPESFF